MILIWKGDGLNFWIVFVLSALLAGIALDFVPLVNDPGLDGLKMGSGFLLAFPPCYCFARYLERKAEDSGMTLVDNDTGEEIVYRQEHSFFGIKMIYWSYFIAVIGLGHLVYGLMQLFLGFPPMRLR